MRSYDLSPLFRATVGFDRLKSLLDSVNRVDEQALSYPPYNIEKIDEDHYRISMAVAGFGEEDLEITVKEGSLVIAGKKAKEEKAEEPTFLYRGIAQRAFERRFDLADHIRVQDASLENGLLHVELVREVPEAMKPRTIRIGSAPKRETKVIESQAA